MKFLLSLAYFICYSGENSPYNWIITEGRKKGMTVNKNHKTVLTGHHPACHKSLGSSILRVPTVVKYIIKKKICTMSQGSVSRNVTTATKTTVKLNFRCYEDNSTGNLPYVH